MARLDVLLARNLRWSRAAARAAIDDGAVSIAGAPALVTTAFGRPPRANRGTERSATDSA